MRQSCEVLWSGASQLLLLIVTVHPLWGALNPGSYGVRRTVVTSFGVVHGDTVFPPGAADLPAVSQFLGIPYGVAPVGQNRFNMPVSAAKWTHQPKEASKLPPVCVQSGLLLAEVEALKSTSGQHFDSSHRHYAHLAPESEDCLHLNLFVPERVANLSDQQQQLSTIVIVHGSEYGWGSGNLYNGSVLAAYGQVIVVTLNYRLGVYGFLGRCESSNCIGNAGLSDLVAALKALSNLLPAFGADTSAITLLGWGSGGALISLLMASPMSQPKNRLFRRAILLDGTALCPWAMVEHPQQYFLALAKELSCLDEHGAESKNTAETRESANHQKPISRILRCLQEHSRQNMTAAARKIASPTFSSTFGPIVDGQVVPNVPKITFSPQFGSLFREIDLMLGTVHYPAHHLLPNADIENGMDLERRDKILRTLVRNHYTYHRTEIFNAIINEYTDWENPRNHPKTLRNSVMAALGDVLYTTPLIQTARMHATEGVLPKAANTFVFLFAHETKSRVREQPNTGIRGTLSGEHVPYVLGYPLGSISRHREEGQIYGGFTDDDRGISCVMMRYVTNFAKTGDPSKPHSISTHSAIEERFHGTLWPQFSQATRESFLEINDRPRIRNFYRNAFVGFWGTFVLQLDRTSNGVRVPEEHNFLPNHFEKNSFFGTVRSFSSLHNHAFPPPPLPPTPFPIETLKKLASSTSAPAASSAPMQKASTNDDADGLAKKAENYGLVITVAVGVGFLVLNLCVYIGIFRMCSERRRKSTKHLKYQSYAIGGMGNFTDVTGTYLHNYTGHQAFPSLNMPPTAHGGNKFTNHGVPCSFESTSNPQQPQHSLISQRISTGTHNTNGSRQTSALLHRMPTIPLTPNGDLHTPNVVELASSIQPHEQEPLLSRSSIHSGSILRAGISPTCPRHGRAAQLAAASRANSVGTGSTTFIALQPSEITTVSGATNMEEVQV